jgi:hypothetical protein
MSKNEYVYPGSDLDRSKILLSLLGTFWSRTYAASDQLHSYVDATAITVSQTYRNLLETAAAMSRFKIPLFHEETIAPIVIRRNELNTAKTNITLFDEDEAARFDGKLIFDVATDKSFFSFPLPKNLNSVAQIFNKITYPTVVLAENVDFVINRKKNAITFISNPFDNPLFARRPIEDTSAADEEITLWGFCGKFDYEYVFNQFAYALSIKMRTSQNYKDFINAIFDGLIAGGLTAKNLDAAFSALCGIPTVMESRETVEVVEYDAAGLLIVTDQNAYKFSADAAPIVGVGDVLAAGTQLVKGVEINEFFFGNTSLRGDDVVSRPEITNLLVANDQENVATEYDDEDILIRRENLACPHRKALSALALDNGFLSTCFYGDIVFENKTTPLIVDTDHPSGYTFVSFALGGFPADVQRFFEELHERGKQAAEINRAACLRSPNDYATYLNLPDVGLVATIYRTLDNNIYYTWEPPSFEYPKGRYKELTRIPPNKKLGTLAHALDSRKYAETEPSADNLPKTINPLRFLIENVLRNNVFVVRITMPALGQNRLGLYNIRHMRQVIPPQTAMIVIFELAAKPDRIDGTKQLSEQTINFKGMEPRADVIDENYVKDNGVILRRISGTCQ